MAKTTSIGRKPKVCLVLQGGGALGAYHIGAYQALEEAGYTPDWFAGISIGALNSTILAGNKPEARLEQLERFWERISWPGTDVTIPTEFSLAFNTVSANTALAFGQPNFFYPRLVNPWVASPGDGATSFYNTAPLFDTMAELSDFGLINSNEVRLTVGATRVTDGELVFFDSYSDTIEPAHAVASGSLPPGFPATKIGEDHYWDGGVVSNTPLNGILELAEDEDLLIFMVDLWNAKGELPQTMPEVLWREKEIQYASRTCEHLEALVAKRNLDHLKRAAPELISSAQVPDVTALTAGKKIDIVHITFDPLQGHIPLSDTEFSRRSIRLRRDCGYKDMQQALRESPWTQPDDKLPVHFHRRQKDGTWRKPQAASSVKPTKRKKAVLTEIV
ncbi:patatin-like phospholipase family protein [Photobacterium gaetbulicola]|uniref:Patatin n=1 Tax=Photobacterium gaetbulicola Gung47 TaxID=658445 RepID=A0A0C5WVB0_9GAMM|nr:patatin-like phospholipase family protein [Photobacterium gaetbulicola]AJR09009.1 Patatin [Photobacterium gaetbulicola Gung47]PSU13565.1 patatin-like phospholipase family protein [Photobacterium gaetbulicola]